MNSTFSVAVSSTEDHAKRRRVCAFCNRHSIRVYYFFRDIIDVRMFVTRVRELCSNDEIFRSVLSGSAMLPWPGLCLSETRMHCAKTAERIEMPFNVDTDWAGTQVTLY